MKLSLCSGPRVKSFGYQGRYRNIGDREFFENLSMLEILCREGVDEGKSSVLKKASDGVESWNPKVTRA